MKTVDLSEIQAIPPSQTIELNGEKISYRKMGKGTPIFCIPPWPSGSLVFYPLSLSLDNYQIISIDLPGWGGYTPAVKETYKLEDYLNLVSNFINSFGFNEYHLLGYSFGGLITQLLLTQNKVTPQKVIYVSTLHSGDEIKEMYGRLLELYKRIESVPLSNAIIREIIKTTTLHSHIHNKELIYPGLEETIMFKSIVDEDIAGCNVKLILGIWFEIFDKNLLDPVLHRYPSKVILADKDPLFIKSESLELADYLGVKPVIIPQLDHDHFVFNVNPSANEIEKFLSGGGLLSRFKEFLGLHV